MRKNNQEEVEVIINQLESKIKRYAKETTFDEREDLSQELRIKLIEKINVLLNEAVPGFFEYTDKL
ncbi:hypothetical protein MKY20_28530 [Cytobacillus sp. FSL W8-0315]|uniref:hypothetical protein n=1 Tax=Cytobacillus sp. FSL W8-0315 TaxID=2921600 RepID=UPI0030FAAC65